MQQDYSTATFLLQTILANAEILVLTIKAEERMLQQARNIAAESCLETKSWKKKGGLYGAGVR